MTVAATDVSDATPDQLTACEAWQTREIEAGLAEAERGEFASDEEVADVLAKYL